MNKGISNIFYKILRSYIRNEPLSNDIFSTLCENDWSKILITSVQQGVIAISYASITQLLKEANTPKKIKLRWALHSEAIEKRGQQQLLLANTLCDMLKAEGINTVVLKGIGLSIYYPHGPL